LEILEVQLCHRRKQTALFSSGFEDGVAKLLRAKRGGNPGNTFNGSSLNSLGLPNPGLRKIIEAAPEMVGIAHAAEKPIIMSVAGFAPAEYLELSRTARELGFDGVELNLGCPNVADGGKRKPIASFDLDLVDQIVSGIYNHDMSPDDRWFLSVKVSPMSNPLQILDTAELFEKFGVSAIVTQNTFPNGMLFNEDGAPQIQTPDKTGWAGFAGRAIKPMALGQVNQWRKALDNLGGTMIPVWGVGGVTSGEGVRDMQFAGASVVQVGTAYFVSGAKVFGDIANEFINL
jgi:dihydroorotate dehydrogenase (fumarate)